MRLTNKKILELVNNNQNLYAIVLSYSINNKDYLDLINEINIKYECNCLANNRRLENVRGRAILVNILRKKGLTLYKIAEIIGMNHCSVNHYGKHYVFGDKKDLEFIDNNSL